MLWLPFSAFADDLRLETHTTVRDVEYVVWRQHHRGIPVVGGYVEQRRKFGRVLVERNALQSVPTDLVVPAPASDLVILDGRVARLALESGGRQKVFRDPGSGEILRRIDLRRSPVPLRASSTNSRPMATWSRLR